MSNAVIWIVTEPYFKEAEKSLESTLKYLPVAKRVLLTPDSYQGNKFDQVVRLPKRQHDHWYLDEVEYFNEALKLDYDKFCFLDSDMLMVNECSDVWRGLDRFDLMLAHAPTRWTGQPTEPLPLTFTEFCSGIVCFRNNHIIKYFFQEWLETYKSHETYYLDNDQVPLRETIWNTELPIKIATLPSEFNTRFGLCGSAIKPVRILHGRYSGDMQDVIEMTDTSHGMVTWQFEDLDRLNAKRKKESDGSTSN